MMTLTVVFFYFKRVARTRLSYRPLSKRGDNPVNLPRMPAPRAQAGVWEVGVTNVIPQHPLACWEPERSNPPRWVHPDPIDGQKTRPKPRLGLTLSGRQKRQLPYQ